MCYVSLQYDFYWVKESHNDLCSFVLRYSELVQISHMSNFGEEKLYINYSFKIIATKIALNIPIEWDIVRKSSSVYRRYPVFAIKTFNLLGISPNRAKYHKIVVDQ